MMLLEAIGLAVGLLLGWLCPWTVPADWTVYVATGLLAALDSALGGVRARLKKQFTLSIFLSGTVGNTAIAVFLAWLGTKMGIPLYLAVVVVFGTRMFQNFAEIRRELLTSGPKSAKINRDAELKPSDGDK